MKKADAGVSRALGHCIRDRRDARRLTQAQVARALGTNIPTISRIENGRRDLLVSELVSFAEELNIRASTLLRAAERESEAA
jgi:transcriptional regulator with XRE-family HTH domain